MSKRSIVILAIVSCALIAAAIGAAVYFSRPARIVERPQEMAIATPAARTLGLAKAAQAGKRVIPAGLYFYGNPFISNNVSQWFQQNWMSVPEVKGTVIEVLWRQTEPIQ